ncbi:MAG: Lrp/AsnC family transcriptional regulator [Pseudomonadota bacterium]
MTLDPADIRLLALLQVDASRPAEWLASRVGASRPSVQRRLARLRSEGIIERQVAVLSAEAVALMTFIVEIELEREQPHLLDEFRRLARSRPEVQQCYYVTGQVDFVLIVLVPDMIAYDAFTRDLFTDEPNIRRFTTQVVVDRAKVGLEMPLGEG